MFSNQQIVALINTLQRFGADVTTTIDHAYLVETGGEVIDEVQISNCKGIGPFPMGAYSAAERISEKLAVIQSKLQGDTLATYEELYPLLDRLQALGSKVSLTYYKRIQDEDGLNVIETVKVTWEKAPASAKGFTNRSMSAATAANTIGAFVRRLDIH
ncbi:hypothetical protein ACYPKM_02220 [Pseudomonas aeruginosa]